MLVGLELPDQDVMAIASGPGGSERWGVELIAEQIDAIVRGDVIRPLGSAGQFAVMLGMGLAGAFARRASAAKPRLVRSAVAVGCAVVCIAAAAAVYRSQHLLVNLPAALVAFALAWWAMFRIEKRGVS